MTRPTNLSTRFTLGHAKVVVRRAGMRWQWNLVTNYGEGLPGTGIETSKTRAQEAGQVEANKYNTKLAGRRISYKRKNVKRGSPQNKISLFSGIA